MLLLSIKEKEKMVIELANEGTTTKEIAKVVYFLLKILVRLLVE
jgi:hypothetical protein